MFRSHYPQGILHHHANLGPYNTAPLITPYMASPFQQGMPSQGLQLVHRPPTIYCSVPPNLFPIPKPNWRVFFFFGKAMEGVWPPSPCMQAYSPGNGCCMWWSWCGGFQISHSRRFFSPCLASENIAFDVDEMWPDQNRKQDAALFLFYSFFL